MGWRGDKTNKEQQAEKKQEGSGFEVKQRVKNEFLL